MSDYVANFANKALSLAAGLVTSILLARYLGVSLRGELSFVTQSAGLLAIILGFGLSQAFPYYFRKDPTRRTYEVFVRYFTLQAALYGTVGALVTIFASSSTVSYLVLLTVAAVSYQQMESVLAAFDLRLKIRVNVGLSAARILLNGLMVISLPASLLWPVAIQAGLWLGVVVVYLTATRVGTGGASSCGDLSGVLSFSWLPMITSALVVMSYNVDTLMLKALGTAEDLGYYAVAAGLVTYFWAIPDAIKEVLVSRVVRSRDPRAILAPLRAGVGASLLVVIGFVSVGRWLVPFLFGSNFAPSYSLAVILSLGVISMTYYKIIGVLMLAEGRRGFYFAAVALAVVLNIGINLVVIPAYGATGAAWASVTTYTLTGVLFVGYFCWKQSIAVSAVILLKIEDFRLMKAVLTRRQRD